MWEVYFLVYAWTRIILTIKTALKFAATQILEKDSLEASDFYF